MVQDTLANGLLKTGVAADLKHELKRNGLWAMLFTALLVFVIWSGWMREQALIHHNETMRATQQAILEEQRRIADGIARVESKVDRLIDRQ